MPNVNGVAAAYEIRRVDPSIKIVFFTNYDVPKNSAACRILGGDAFVSKSAGIVELLATVKGFLKGGTCRTLPLSDVSSCESHGHRELRPFTMIGSPRPWPTQVLQCFTDSACVASLAQSPFFSYS